MFPLELVSQNFKEEHLPSLRGVMRRLEDVIRDGSILIFLGGIAVIWLAPTLSRQTELLLSVPPTREAITLRPLQIFDEHGTSIGWWQITLNPTSVMIGDTAELEVTYQARRSELSPSISVSSLSAEIEHSDLPYTPEASTHEFDVHDIWASRGLKGNHIWHLSAEEGKTAPGRKSVILNFRVQPTSLQQRKVAINGQPITVNGSEVSIPFSVRTATGLPRQFSAICTAAFAALGAIGSSAAFLTVL